MRSPLGGRGRLRLRPRRARTLGVALLLVVAAWVGGADADVITLTGTGYQVTTPAGVSVGYSGVAGTFPDTSVPYNGTLTIDASFPTLDPLTLNFVQTSQVGSTTASGGLRLALNTLMANGSADQTWVGFTYVLQDLTDLSNVNTGNQDNHLSVAHFHPESDPKKTGSPTYATTVFSVLAGADNTSSILLGAGMVPPGGEFSLSDALLHERNYLDKDSKPVLRSFNLILTPIPEPASLALLALGAVGLAGFARRRAAGAPPAGPGRG